MPQVHPSSSNVVIELTSDVIRLSDFRHCIADADVGAHGWFEGVTRRLTGDRETLKLSYDAFVPMAVSELRKIAEQTMHEFDLTAVVIVHRLGEVPIGEASLLVGCSSPHRAAVFQALPKIVNRLKQDVPIWKKEYFADGTIDWVHPS